MDDFESLKASLNPSDQKHLDQVGPKHLILTDPSLPAVDSLLEIYPACGSGCSWAFLEILE